MDFCIAVAYNDPNHLCDIARTAEEAGFGGIIVSDHIIYPGNLETKYPYTSHGRPRWEVSTPWPDPMVAVGAMSAVTERIRFICSIYLLALRHPVLAAKSISTAAVMSNNRLTVGVGAGWMREEFETMGVEFKTRGKRLDESIEVLHKLWSGDLVEHHGTHFDFPLLSMCPVPEKRVPVWVGGISGPALRRAARVGDGWLGSGQTADQAVELLNELNGYRKEYGRENEPFESIVPLVTPPTPDDLKKIEDAGADATVSYPFTYTVGPTSTLDTKRAYLEGFAEGVIKTMG